MKRQKLHTHLMPAHLWYLKQCLGCRHLFKLCIWLKSVAESAHIAHYTTIRLSMRIAVQAHTRTLQHNTNRWRVQAEKKKHITQQQHSYETHRKEIKIKHHTHRVKCKAHWNWWKKRQHIDVNNNNNSTLEPRLYPPMKQKTDSGR